MKLLATYALVMVLEGVPNECACSDLLKLNEDWPGDMYCLPAGWPDYLHEDGREDDTAGDCSGMQSSLRPKPRPEGLGQ